MTPVIEQFPDSASYFGYQVLLDCKDGSHWDSPCPWCGWEKGGAPSRAKQLIDKYYWKFKEPQAREVKS